MVQNTLTDKTVCVVGLGYVGLPLAETFSRKITTIGYEIIKEKARKIAEQTDGPLQVTSDPTEIKKADFVLICVPTPVKKAKEPDLSFVESSARIIGQNLKKDAIVVLESTVYPGVTEDIVMPILEQESGLTCGQDFYVGYSPERINPGDAAHELENITKVVSGMNPECTKILYNLYSLITTVYVAPDIRTAEAAKVIENIQRDLNIALMNELSIIFQRMNINTHEVIKAASTKWNFHQYRPGLVGGHCIPVDPYYLVYKAQELGYHPQVILAGRSINDSMPRHVARMAIKELNETGQVIKGSKVLILGLTYKENVADTRESPVEAMIEELKEFHVEVYGYDPLLAQPEIEHFGAKYLANIDPGKVSVNCVIINSPHDQFQALTITDLIALCGDEPIIIDVTGMLRNEKVILETCRYWTL